jgi:hypothetical protein
MHQFQLQRRISTDVDVPTSGHFIDGVLSLAGMRLYQWNELAEVALRKAIASAADVPVSHVRVNSVSEDAHRIR